MTLSCLYVKIFIHMIKTNANASIFMRVDVKKKCNKIIYVV